MYTIGNMVGGIQVYRTGRLGGGGGPMTLLHIEIFGRSKFRVNYNWIWCNRVLSFIHKLYINIKICFGNNIINALNLRVGRYSRIGINV